MGAEAHSKFQTFEHVVNRIEHKISENGSGFVLVWNGLEGPNQFYLKQTALLDE
jgi:hypothetical protein